MSIPSPLATKTPKLDPVPKPQSVGLDAADPSVSLPVGFYTQTGVKPTDFWWQPHPCCPSDGLGDKNAAWGQNLGPAKKSGPSDPAYAIHWMMQQGFLRAHVHFPGEEFPQQTGIIGEIIGISERFGEDAKGKRAGGEVGAGFEERSGGAVQTGFIPQGCLTK